MRASGRSGMKAPAMTGTISVPRTDQVSADIGVGLLDCAALPSPGDVMILARTVPPVAHAVRVTRRGHQTLVSFNGRAAWVQTARVVARPAARDLEATPA